MFETLSCQHWQRQTQNTAPVRAFSAVMPAFVYFLGRYLASISCTKHKMLLKGMQSVLSCLLMCVE